MKKTTRRHILSGIAAAVISLTILNMDGTPSPSTITNLTEGTHYHSISEKISNEPLVMYFWYGCPHCLKTYSVLKKQGFFKELDDKGIVLKKVPVPGSSLWTMHASLYYALEKYDVSMDGHLFVMDFIQNKNPNVSDELIESLIQNEKKIRPEFNATLEEIRRSMKSSLVNSKILESKSLIDKIGINGVPTMVVNGKHRVELSRNVTYNDFGAVSLRLLSEME